MFELSIALKYLIPRKKSLSTALISAMSIGVISLVVWLVLVFLSVTAGIEKNWLHRMTALYAPIRLSPTSAYFDSYFYRVDAISSASNYQYKTVGEKWESSILDPHVKEEDPQVPVHWKTPDYDANGQLKDIVKLAYESLGAVQKTAGVTAFQDYEIGGALLRLSIREQTASLSQMSYLLSIPDENPNLSSLILEEEEGSHFAKEPENPPAHIYFIGGKLRLPQLGEDAPILLPKNYRDAGASLGDRGTLGYKTFAAASVQEQKIPVRVAGFYDPGVMAMGSKCVLVPKEITRSIFAAQETFSPDGTPTNGIFVWNQDLDQTGEIKQKIINALEQAGIAKYWNVSTYEDFEFAKDLLQQFRSDRMLLLLVGAIILIVACSNIISLLVLLVNDKKKEIAILQSMGASYSSIAAIFGLCGIIMGLISSIIGVALAAVTLHHLDTLISGLSALQGRSVFNPAFFGTSLPNQLSLEAIVFIVIATPLLSLAAGLIPAIKASRIRPSLALRSE